MMRPARAKGECQNAATSLPVLFLVIIAAVVVLVPLGSGERNGRKKVLASRHVKAKTCFLSRAERQFDETLKQALPAGFVAIPNARSQDKHINFLIMAVKDDNPVFGIELDSSSYDRLEQQYRDAVKGTVFRSAGLPLLRFRNEDEVSVAGLRVALGAYL